MKFLQKIGLGLVAVLAVTTAQAQTGFDAFAAMRWMTIIPMTNIVTSTGGANGTTNFVDRIGFEGIAAIIIPWQTNVNGGATGTVYVQSSPDQTNWTALSYAQATNVTRAVITNSAYATTNVFLTATNTEILPGPFTTPVATAGYVSPYVGPSISFTNTNSITLSSASTGTTLIGFNVGDAARYIRVGFVAGTTNSTVGAFMVGRKNVYQ